MAVLQYKDPVTGQLKDLPLINQGVKEAPIDGKQYARKDGEWSEIDVDSNVDLSDYTTKGELNNALLGKVDKQEGKQLTTEDFTTVLKRKLEGLSNYNDTEIRNAIDSLESAFNTLVEGNATVAIDTFNEIVAFLKNVENSQDLDSIIAGINTTISKVEAKIPDTNNFLSKDGGTMNNTNLVGNLNAELLNGYSSDKFVSIINHIKDSTTTDALTVGLNTINQDYLWTNTPYSDIATLVDMSYSPDWRSLFFISPSTGRIHTRFKHNGDTWTNWKEIAFTDGSVANADMLDGYHESAFLRYRGETVTDRESTLWHSLGMKQYINALPDGIGDVYNYGEVISLPSSNVRFDIYVSNVSTADHKKNGIYVRSGWDSNRQPWKRLAFADDPVAAANKLSTTRYLWGRPFDGSDNVVGDLFLTKTSLSDSNNDAGKLFFSGSNSTNHGVYLSATKYDTYGRKRFGIFTTNAASDTPNWVESFSIIPDGRVGIGVNNPTYKLHINGPIKAEYNPDYDLAHTLIGETHFYNDSYSDPATNIKAVIKVNGTIAQSSGNVLLCTKSGNVGIGTTTPRGTLDVNGDIQGSGHLNLNATSNYVNNYSVSIINNSIASGWTRAFELLYPNASEGALLSLRLGKERSSYNEGCLFFRYRGYGSSQNHISLGLNENDYILNVLGNSSVGINTTTPEYTLDVNGYLGVRGKISMLTTDQINGLHSGITLNYECGKAVNTAIWDGQGNQIIGVFGEGRQVAIGAHAIDTPRGILNVDGEVIFEQSRFTTTSGFVDGDYAYSHAIYGGYHGIDVCEFYEDEFRFKNNGGSITFLKLTSNDAFFNGIVHSSYSSFIGRWNNRERFRLIRDAEFNTWLQAATDTTNESGKLFMSGMYGTHLSEFNVFATASNFKGSIIAEGDVTAYSDIRLKNRIESVNNVLDTIGTLDVFRYTWKNREDKSVHIGVSAQQVQNIYPEFVLTSNSEDGTYYLTVNYAALATCIAIQGIKELAKKGDERDKRIAALEEEVISLKEQLRYGNK